MLKVRNWSKFQHYKGRRPPWIKLHRELLEDRAFLALPLAAQALAPRLWLLASESEDGTLSSDPADLAFRMRCSEPELVAAVKALIDSKFLSGQIDAASAALAPCPHVATPEKETEKSRGEEKTESSPEAPLLFPAVPDPAETILAAWSERTGTKLRAPGSIQATLRRIRARLRDGFSESDLMACVGFAMTDEFYAQRNYAKNPNVVWKNAERVQDLLTRAQQAPTQALARASPPAPRVISREGAMLAMVKGGLKP